MAAWRDALHQYLLGRRDEISFVVRFAELGHLADLPTTASKEPAFWANSRKSRPHAAAWLDAGFNAHPDFVSGTVRFERGPDRGRR